ncbi:MAG: HAD family hydrolase [Chloroflexi bacterium]|nr:HAD family hydrolase [Chloroflexota bacterium]MCY3582745.1 HAD family hydrolase [Chloroflexota bacterium]MCY3717468.1 HAD family hydrolase [Chloroflexota bacterium]MDE2652046.1 HAD family hydrolase [Chloroflexota bacterium]
MPQRIIAMWSGPRNISTALMRSWGSRSDTRVLDEPFYAHYLLSTGYQHPGAEEIIGSYSSDWRAVIDELLRERGDIAILYQKHMTHHMLPHIDRSWLGKVSSSFLIREPRRMLLSLMKVIPEPGLEQTGLPQQVELFETVCALTGAAPPVIDARDVLQQPATMLRHLCCALDVPFCSGMLSWPPGVRATDGVWAKHWYAAVERSTGFAPYQADDSPLPERLRGLLDACQPLYDTLARYRIRPGAA